MFCRRVADCVEPSAVLKTNLTIGATEFDAVVVKNYPRNMEYEWLNTVRSKLLSSARVYQKALSRQPRLLLLIVMKSDHVSLEEKLQQTSAFVDEYRSAEFPLRIEFLSNSAIGALTCERVQSILYE